MYMTMLTIVLIIVVAITVSIVAYHDDGVTM